MTSALNVVGLVVHVRPERLTEVVAALGALEGMDVHALTADGRIIATAIDSGDTLAIDQLAAVNRLPGVVSAMLAYHEIDLPSPPAEGRSIPRSERA